MHFTNHYNKTISQTCTASEQNFLINHWYLKNYPKLDWKHNDCKQIIQFYDNFISDITHLKLPKLKTNFQKLFDFKFSDLHVKQFL